MQLQRLRPSHALTALVLGATLLAGCASDESGNGDPGTTGSTDATSSESRAAAEWLVAGLDDGLLTTSYESPAGSGKWVTTPDYGLTLDAFFALDEDDFESERTTILDALEPRVGEYVGSGKDAYAGSTGKVVAALQAAERDPGDFGGQDLLTKLEGLVQGDGPEKGRAKDTWAPSNEFGADYSNTIGQAWVVRALVTADSDLSDGAVGFLVKQQCREGFFRLLMESSDFTCDAGATEQSVPNVDATGFAVQALAAAQSADVESEAASEALSAACGWLVDSQADDGSFVDADSGQPNTNSTGVAADALLTCDEDEAAARAGDYLRAHQVTESEAEGRLADHVGAVAYDHAALEAGQTKGITKAVRYQWLRATAQSVDALGAGAS